MTSADELKKAKEDEAIVGVMEGPIKQVYLKRPVRQDETGIWWVAGYDPRYS